MSWVAGEKKFIKNDIQHYVTPQLSEPLMSHKI